jgi:hypothetical protein
MKVVLVHGLRRTRLSLLKSGIATCFVAGCILRALSQSCLAESPPAWSGAAVKITDLLQPSTNQGQYFLAQASVMTSNGCHVAKVEGSRSEGYLVRRDGKAGRRYTEVGVPVFSQDGTGLAYVAFRGGKSFLVTDDSKGTEYDFIGHCSFSPNGKHIAFGAKRGGKMVIVVDGKERAAYASVPAGPVFRADGVLEFLAVDDTSLCRIEVAAF